MKVFGVTVHFVDEGVDSGPVILQRAIELPDAVDAEAVHDVLRLTRPVRRQRPLRRFSARVAG